MEFSSQKFVAVVAGIRPFVVGFGRDEGRFLTYTSPHGA